MAGHFLWGGTCYFCPSGTWTPEGTDLWSCEGCSHTCAACDRDTGICTACRAGAYISMAGVCANCPSHTWSPGGAGVLNCTVCEPAGVCVACEQWSGVCTANATSSNSTGPARNPQFTASMLTYALLLFHLALLTAHGAAGPLVFVAVFLVAVPLSAPPATFVLYTDWFYLLSYTVAALASTLAGLLVAQAHALPNLFAVTRAASPSWQRWGRGAAAVLVLLPAFVEYDCVAAAATYLWVGSSVALGLLAVALAAFGLLFVPDSGRPCYARKQAVAALCWVCVHDVLLFLLYNAFLLADILRPFYAVVICSGGVAVVAAVASVYAGLHTEPGEEERLHPHER